MCQLPKVWVDSEVKPKRDTPERLDISSIKVQNRARIFLIKSKPELFVQ